MIDNIYQAYCICQLECCQLISHYPTHSISGPIPGVSSKFDSSVGGKFTAVKPPKIVKPEDMAPPPKDGERVKVVSHDEIFVSQRG